MTKPVNGPADSQGALKERPGPEPGIQGPARGRELRVLRPQECLDLLAPGGVGRVGLMSCDGIVMLPVNYAIAAGSVVFRTAPDTLLAALANAPASFEADHLTRRAAQAGASWSRAARTR